MSEEREGQASCHPGRGLLPLFCVSLSHQPVQRRHLDHKRKQVVHDSAQKLVRQLAPREVGDRLWEWEEERGDEKEFFFEWGWKKPHPLRAARLFSLSSLSPPRHATSRKALSPMGVWGASANSGP